MATEKDVKTAFAALGQIVSVKVRVKPGKAKSWALVSFTEPEVRD